MSNFLAFLPSCRQPSKITGFHMRLIGLSMLALGICQGLSAQEAITNLPLDEQVGMTDMPSVGPLFISTNLFKTHVSLVNAGNANGSGELLLQGLDGSTLVRQNVTIRGHSSVSLDVAELLSEAGSAAQEGRVEFYGKTDSSGIAGQLTLSYTDRGHKHLIDEELMMPTVKSSTKLRGIAVGGTGSPYVAVANSELFPEAVTAECYPEGGLSQTFTFTIPAGQTTLLHGCANYEQKAGVSWLDGQGETRVKGRAYAIELRLNTPHGAIQAFGLAPASLDRSKDWTSMDFFDPATVASPLTIFAGIPFGNTPVLWGTYDPQLAVHNYTDHVQTVEVALDATVSGFAVHTILSSIPLRPNESKTLDAFQGAGSTELLNTITVKGSDSAGGIGSQLLLRNTARDLLVQLVGKSGADDTNIGMHPWELSDTEDSDLLLYNQTQKSRRVRLKIANGKVTWEKTVLLGPLITQSFSVKNLVQQHSLDDKGRELKRGDGYGEISWAADRSGYVKGRLLRLNSSSQTAESFQCAAYQVLCNATISGPTSMNEGQSSSWGGNAEACINNEAANYCWGTPSGSANPSNYTWGVGGGLNPTGGLNSYSVTAEATGGTGYLNVNMSDFNGCSVSASQTVTETGYPGATITSVNPPVWVAGTSFVATITGTNFGSNPSVSLVAPGVAPSATTAPSNGTSLTIPVSVAPDAPSGPVAITVIPGYPGTSYICGSACNGGNGYGTAGAVVQAVTPAPQIMFNGQNISGKVNIPVWAGQKITLSVSAPSGYSISSSSWSFNNQGHLIGGYTNSSASGPPSATAGGQAQGAQTSGNTITNYFIVPGPTEPLTYTYTLDNGQSASATASFKVSGPTPQGTNSTYFSASASTVNVWPTGSAAVALRNPGLEFGDGINVAGMFFKVAAQVPSNPGAFQWVQLIHSLTRNYFSQPPTSTPTPGSGLDNWYPYEVASGNPTVTTDSPGLELYTSGAVLGEAAMQFRATMYLMWDPSLDANGGNASGCAASTVQDVNKVITSKISTCAGSIPIPLGYVDWGFSACAINTLQSQPATQTTWLLQCSNIIAPNVQPGGSYPNWIAPPFLNQ